MSLLRISNSHTWNFNIYLVAFHNFVFFPMVMFSSVASFQDALPVIRKGFYTFVGEALPDILETLAKDLCAY